MSLKYYRTLMYDEQQNQIEDIAETFTKGIPVSTEVKFTEHIHFHFDNPFEDDLEENSVVGDLIVDREAYPDFDMDTEDIEDRDELDEIRELVESALYDGGFNDVYVENDKTNSNDTHLVFHFRIFR